jgi:hypothetical protein
LSDTISKESFRMLEMGEMGGEGWCGTENLSNVRRRSNSNESRRPSSKGEQNFYRPVGGGGGRRTGGGGSSPPQFVGQTKPVGQYSLHSRAILMAYYKNKWEKFCQFGEKFCQFCGKYVI